MANWQLKKVRAAQRAGWPMQKCGAPDCRKRWPLKPRRKLVFCDDFWEGAPEGRPGCRRAYRRVKAIVKHR
jgi:hypothetical protein